LLANLAGSELRLRTSEARSLRACPDRTHLCASASQSSEIGLLCSEVNALLLLSGLGLALLRAAEAALVPKADR
jgi:hypothetical protein